MYVELIYSNNNNGSLKLQRGPCMFRTVGPLFGALVICTTSLLLNSPVYSLSGHLLSKYLIIQFIKITLKQH